MTEETKKDVKTTPPEQGKAPEEQPIGPLMEEAMRAYGIRPKHVAGSRDYGDHVVIVTNGGRKVSFAPGDKVRRLSQVELDGNPPPKAQSE